MTVSPKPHGLQRDPEGEVLLHVRRRAMATEFAVLMPGGSPAEATEAALEALEIIGGLEAKLSVFRPDSDISRVNRWAGERPVAVDPEVFALLARSLELCEQTGGAFDITAGPLIEAWGFLQRRGRKPTEEEIEAARQRVGFRHVRLDAAARTVAFDAPGMAINLGAIGKGYALDRAARFLKAHGVEDFLIHGGQSSIRASGVARPPHPRPWRIALRHPTRPGVALGRIRMRDESLATSGSGKQFFHFRGKRMGHVIDPRTGWPAGDLLSLTLLGPDAATADALATALYVMGHDAAQELLASMPDTAMICVAREEGSQSLRIETWNVEDRWVPEEAYAGGTARKAERRE